LVSLNGSEDRRKKFGALANATSAPFSAKESSTNASPGFTVEGSDVAQEELRFSVIQARKLMPPSMESGMQDAVFLREYVLCMASTLRDRLIQQAKRSRNTHGSQDAIRLCGVLISTVIL
jgi:hypothetical protein